MNERNETALQRCKAQFACKLSNTSGGFTLVELIVVIAILGILAAVAVPTYSGYITKANTATVEAAGASYLTAAQSAAVLEGTYVTSAKVDTDGTFVFTINDSTVAGDVLTAFEEFSGVGATNSSDTITTSSAVVNTSGTDYATNAYVLKVTGAADGGTGDADSSGGGGTT